MKKLINHILRYLLLRKVRNSSGIIGIEERKQRSNFFGNKVLDKTTCPYKIEGAKNFSFLADLPKSTASADSFYTIEKQVRLVGVFSIAMSSDGRIFWESVLSSKEYLLKTGDAKYILFYKFLKARIKVDYAINLNGVLSRAYFHWVMECLPLMQGYVAFKKANPDIRVKIIVNAHSHTFQLEYLAAFGVGEEDVIRAPIAIDVKHLIMTSPSFDRLSRAQKHSIHIYKKSAFDWMREHLLSTKVFSGDTPQRIYISRKDAKGRRIINERELEILLKRLGIASVILSEMKVVDQIALFYGVNLVIAPHGAGIVNTIFGKNASLIELFPSDVNADMGHVFYQTSQMFLKSHTVLMCQSGKNSNMLVDLENLEGIIEKLDI